MWKHDKNQTQDPTAKSHPELQCMLAVENGHVKTHHIITHLSIHQSVNAQAEHLHIQCPMLGHIHEGEGDSPRGEQRGGGDGGGDVSILVDPEVVQEPCAAILLLP